MIKKCPFCGSDGEFSHYRIDRGGGDFQWVYKIICSNDNCPVKPCVTKRGESGYRVGDTHTNKQAEQFVKEAWNKRT